MAGSMDRAPGRSAVRRRSRREDRHAVRAHPPRPRLSAEDHRRPADRRGAPETPLAHKLRYRRGLLIVTAHLFPVVERRLLELLRSLDRDEWDLQTIAGVWTVRDVAAHLLDTQLRRLSMGRDRHFIGPRAALDSNDELIAFINRMNSDGVAIYRRLSPAVLTSLMEAASSQLCDYMQTLDPMAPASIGVSWAGESESANWFDIAREYTERWHHQQQIRLAANRPGIMTRELYYPVLDCFMRALPYAYRDRSGEPGTHLQFNVSGDCGGSWYLHRDADRWAQVDRPEGRQASETTIPQDIAWRIFTKGIDRESAAAQVSVTGDRDLGAHVLGMVAIIG